MSPKECLISDRDSECSCPRFVIQIQMLRAVKIAIARARTPPTAGNIPLLKAGINCFKPYQRKNKTTHQSATIDRSILLSPLWNELFCLDNILTQSIEDLHIYNEIVTFSVWHRHVYNIEKLLLCLKARLIIILVPRQFKM